MIILYFLILFFISILIINTNPRRIKNSILISSIILAMLAFFQIVREDSDLMVAFEHIDNIRKFGWSYFNNDDIINNMYFSGRYALKIYFYLLSFLPFDNFYSAISIFFIYYLSLKGSLIACKYYKIPSLYTKYILILLIWLIDFYDAANGVRNMLSFSIFVYALVYDLCNDKKKYIPYILYIISPLLHSSAWLLIALRLILFIKNKYIITLFLLLLIFWSFGLEYTSIISDSSNTITESMNHHIEAYTDNNNNASGNFDVQNYNNSSSYLLMRFFRILHILIIVYFIFKIYKKYRNLSSLHVYILLLSAFCIGSTFSNIAANVLTRYSFSIIFLTPIFYSSYIFLPMKKKKFIIINNYIIEHLALLLIIITVLFNYYMFRYHYHYMFFGFNLYL